MSKPINRITLFKVPNPDDIPAILEKYTTLTTDAKKDSKPYITSAKANAVIPDPAGRNQDFTIAANTVFASLDDMKFYDEDCEAHKAIKAFLKPRIQGVMTVYYEAN
ncbi:stress responsive a b barrel domain-containing protein [Diplodia corticola]|uniref:Stress responsive a b barrel domain-containing protein n=1 Tax=Diplodia corticola TaxID=236234 RepID=A0A1J9S750_9PEZI|nr:stress responsive a b barrel domain-containing protein [Diplodia corticola]OJD40779.1 stress responsive a b barrel domain-containing protein [Diplodia corticola]